MTPTGLHEGRHVAGRPAASVRQEDGAWVAEVPAISGCYALIATREEAVAELSHVFDMIAEEYQERGARWPRTRPKS